MITLTFEHHTYRIQSVNSHVLNHSKYMFKPRDLINILLNIYFLFILINIHFLTTSPHVITSFISFGIYNDTWKKEQEKCVCSSSITIFHQIQNRVELLMPANEVANDESDNKHLLTSIRNHTLRMRQMATAIKAFRIGIPLLSEVKGLSDRVLEVPLNSQ